MGLLDSENSSQQASYGVLIQSFNRFIMDQLNSELAMASNPIITKFRLGHDQEEGKEASDDPTTALTMIQQLSGVEGKSKSRCNTCTQEQVRDTISLVIDMIYPKPGVATSVSASPALFQQYLEKTGCLSSSETHTDTEKTRPPRPHDRDLSSTLQAAMPVCQLLESSLCRFHQNKAWCATCRRYQLTSYSKLVAAPLPPLLNINCCVTGEDDRKFWRGNGTPADPCM